MDPEEPSEDALKLIRDELDVERAAQEKRAETVDSRAGITIAAAGGMAVLAANAKTVWTLPGAVVAVGAVAMAAWSLLPRRHETIKPRGLYMWYANEKPSVTLRFVLGTRIGEYERNQDQLEAKLRRFEQAVVLLVAAVVLVVAGVTVGTLTSKPTSTQREVNSEMTDQKPGRDSGTKNEGTKPAKVEEDSRIVDVSKRGDDRKSNNTKR